MIHKNLLAEYLSPQLWTNLGTVLACFKSGQKVLHVLENYGEYKAVWEDKGPFPSADGKGRWEGNPGDIWELYPDLTEIRVYTMDGIKRYYEKVQCKENCFMDSDLFLKKAEACLDDTEGIKRYRREEGASVLERLTTFLGAREGLTLIWLTRKGELFFNCIAEVREGSLVRISTSDRYGEEEFDEDTVYSKMCEEFTGPYHHVKIKMETLQNDYGDIQ